MLWPLLLLLLAWLSAQKGPAVAPRLALCLPPGCWGGGHHWRPKAAVHVAVEAELLLLRHTTRRWGGQAWTLKGDSTALIPVHACRMVFLPALVHDLTFQEPV